MLQLASILPPIFCMCWCPVSHKLTSHHGSHRCRMLVALLKLMEARYVCPASPVFLNDPIPHLHAYLGLLPLISGGQLSVAGLSAPAERAGGRLLASTLGLLHFSEGDRLQFLRQQQQAAPLLEQPEAQQQLSRALAALSAGRPEGLPPFALRQLQFACHVLALDTAFELCLHTAVFPSSGAAAAPASLEALRQLPGAAEAAAAARLAAAALWRLQPDHPSTLHVAAQMLPDGLVAPRLATMQQLLRSMRRAEASGRAVWTIRLAGAAAMASFHVQPAATPVDLADLQQALQRAVTALERDKRLLPQPWVYMAHASIPLWKQVLEAGQLALAAASAQQTCDYAALAAADQQRIATLNAFFSDLGQHTKNIAAGRICDGCGKAAEGLRACARCRTAHYCSRECQAAHWPQHKRECRPA